jgi:peptide-methionine (R)-S-oxide reductase
MNRRSLLQVLGASLLAGAGARAASGGDAAGTRKAGAVNVAELQHDWRKLLAPNASVARDATPVARPDDEWRELLPADSYRVLRHEATERPFSSPLNDEHRAGVFVCAGCALPLFTSAMKFDSGTGWPSFFTTIPGAFATKTDHLFIVARTEYHCSKCAGHHGHIFDDGPAPTGLRYCNNGVALRFIPQHA